jgi:hypothetical protein
MLLSQGRAYHPLGTFTTHGYISGFQDWSTKENTGTSDAALAAFGTLFASEATTFVGDYTDRVLNGLLKGGAISSLPLLFTGISLEALVITCVARDDNEYSRVGVLSRAASFTECPKGDELDGMLKALTDNNDEVIRLI